MIQSNSTHEVALDILANIHDTLVYEDIDLAYRIGKKKSDSPRPILVKFPREAIRNEINKRKRNLNDSDTTRGSYINEDLPSKLNQRRSDIRSIVNNARAKNLEAKAMGDRFSIGDTVYSYADVASFPPCLSLEDAKMISTPKGIAFQGSHSFLSPPPPKKRRREVTGQGVRRIGIFVNKKG